MSFFRDRSGSCGDDDDEFLYHQDQDDLAMFELSTNPKDGDGFSVDFGGDINRCGKDYSYLDGNEDDGSDLIVIDTSTANMNILGGEIDADYDSDVIVIDATTEVLGEKMTTEYDNSRKHSARPRHGNSKSPQQNDATPNKTVAVADSSLVNHKDNDKGQRQKRRLDRAKRKDGSFGAAKTEKRTRSKTSNEAAVANAVAVANSSLDNDKDNDIGQRQKRRLDRAKRKDGSFGVAKTEKRTRSKTSNEAAVDVAVADSSLGNNKDYDKGQRQKRRLDRAKRKDGSFGAAKTEKRTRSKTYNETAVDNAVAVAIVDSSLANDKGQRQKRRLDRAKRKDGSFGVAKTEKRTRSKLLEGRNASEPIHIDDDDNDEESSCDGGKFVCSKKNKSTEAATPTISCPNVAEHKNSDRKNAFGSKTSTCIPNSTYTANGKKKVPMKIGRKRSRSVLEKKKEMSHGDDSDKKERRNLVKIISPIEALSVDVGVDWNRKESKVETTSSEGRAGNGSTTIATVRDDLVAAATTATATEMKTDYLRPKFSSLSSRYTANTEINKETSSRNSESASTAVENHKDTIPLQSPAEVTDLTGGTEVTDLTGEYDESDEDDNTNEVVGVSMNEGSHRRVPITATAGNCGNNVAEAKHVLGTRKPKAARIISKAPLEITSASQGVTQFKMSLPLSLPGKTSLSRQQKGIPATKQGKLERERKGYTTGEKIMTVSNCAQTRLVQKTPPELLDKSNGEKEVDRKEEGLSLISLNESVPDLLDKSKRKEDREEILPLISLKERRMETKVRTVSHRMETRKTSEFGVTRDNERTKSKTNETQVSSSTFLTEKTIADDSCVDIIDSNTATISISQCQKLNTSSRDQLLSKEQNDDEPNDVAILKDSVVIGIPSVVKDGPVSASIENEDSTPNAKKNEEKIDSLVQDVNAVCQNQCKEQNTFAPSNDVNKLNGCLVRDMPSVMIDGPMSASIEKKDYISNVKKNEEKIGSFLQSVHGFPTQRKQLIEITDVDAIECIELDVNDQSENTQKYGRNIDLMAAKSKIITKTDCRTNMKPRFKPQKNKRTKKNEKESIATRDRERDLIPKSKECSHDEGSSEFRSSPNKNSSIAFKNGHGDKYQNMGTESYTTRKFPFSQENRFIFHPSNSRTKSGHNYRNSFLGMNIEDAHIEQERLLKRSAARLRTQAAFRVISHSDGLKKTPYSKTFTALVRDVHLKFTDHWRYSNHYSRLGLPGHANESMIKSQYRRLARIYHPDRNLGKPDTKHKFQALTEAYNSVMNA